MVITNGELVARYQPVSGPVEAGRDPVLTLHLVTADEPAQKVVGPSSVSARSGSQPPACTLVRPPSCNLAKRFRSRFSSCAGQHVTPRAWWR